ncbi:GNAT family N-acetyltransferase [Bosea sp. TWI1241]|uniref:GNAT family N-acetyltransferase n=1 Tax=Bosea sp. TWI1241 TaxID=3148904 RepID=UPI00320ACB41
MTESDPASPRPAGTPAPDGRRLRVEHDIAALEPLWRAFEREALVTPYQAYDWVRPFVETVGRADGMQARFVVVEAADGTILALLPLAIERRLGASLAAFIGGKHANYHMGLYRKDFAAALDDAAAARLFQAVGALLAVDALAFVNQPPDWQGVRNPAARLPGGPSPSRSYKLALIPGDGEATLRRAMSKHARKKMTTKHNRFAEFGPSRLLLAGDAAEIERVLDAFLLQKAARFAQMGLPDPFAAPAMRAFFRQAALAGNGQKPVIELHALELNGGIVATYVGAVQGGRFSGMATSFDLDSVAARTSPGEILLIELIRAKCEEGLTMFDLGVGEARYKTTICDDSDALVDSFLPLTAKGRVHAQIGRARRALKRTIKGSPRLLALVRRVQALRTRARPPADEA